MNPDSISAIAAILAAIIAGVAAITGIINLMVTRKINERTLSQKVHEEERKEIYKELNSFYGPFQHNLETSRQLYAMFSASQGPEFRTLPALLRGQKFVGNDEVLLRQIIAITEKLDGLISAYSGAVEDEELNQLLGKASAHFRLINLAYKGELTDEPRFRGQEYPRELNAKIDQQISKLQARIEELNRM